MDRSALDAPRDLATDLTQDLPWVDLPKADLSKPDAAKADLKKPDAKKPDAKPLPDLPGCYEQGTINSSAATCNNQCTVVVTDSDCDGIPNPRDPSSTCNRLLSSEHFSATLPSTKWTAGGTGATTWPCGSASLSPGASLTLGATELAKITSGKFLVEAKYTLGVQPSGNWSVRLNFQKPGDPNAWINCEQWVNATYGGKGGAHLNDHYCEDSGSWLQTTFDVSSGRTYYLQLYSTGSTVNCRVVNEANLVDSLSRPCAVGAPGKLFLATTRAITVDHIRIFQF